ncbi:MAG: sodium:solute symporter family protein [Pirellulales bacterium]|nr:sodium:solute symporter family protein [Pirellulales bacterium]
MYLVDWFVLVVLLLALLGVGWWCRRYMRSVADFVVVNRKMRKYLGLSTWSAEGVGLITVVYMAEQGFREGLAYVWLTLANMLLYVPLFGILGFGIRRYRATRVQTIPQFHEMRYSRGVRVCVGVALAVGGILNMAVFPILSSRFLVALLDLPTNVNLVGYTCDTAYPIMAVLIAISLALAVSGGMVSVIITDYLQSIILSFSIFFITALIFLKVGLSRITDTMQQVIGERAFNPLAEGGYGVSWIVFFVLSGVLAPLTFPPSTTKLSSADKPDTTRHMALLAGLFQSGRGIIVLLWGVAALAMLGATAPTGVDSDQYARYATATFIREISLPGTLGLCITGLLFAYFTTGNSYSVSWAAIVVNDIVQPLRSKPLEAKSHIWLMRWVIVAIGCFLFFWGIVFDPKESILSYIYLTGAIFTAAGVITFVGLYWRRANAMGAYLTVLFCMLVPLTDIVCKNILKINYPLESHQSGLIALLLSFVAFLVCGMLSRSGERKWVDYGALARREDALAREQSASAKSIALEVSA